jgi:hypothetical protein
VSAEMLNLDRDDAGAPLQASGQGPSVTEPASSAIS